MYFTSKIIEKNVVFKLIVCSIIWNKSLDLNSDSNGVEKAVYSNQSDICFISVSHNLQCFPPTVEGSIVRTCAVIRWSKLPAKYCSLTTDKAYRGGIVDSRGLKAPSVRSVNGKAALTAAVCPRGSMRGLRRCRWLREREMYSHAVQLATALG